MKIAVIGAGAIGGLVGARLALAGEEVSFMVRGANLEAIRARGIRLVEMDGEAKTATQVKAFDDYAAAGPQDIVVLAVKAHQVAGVAGRIGQLFGPDTTVVTMQNFIGDLLSRPLGFERISSRPSLVTVPRIRVLRAGRGKAAAIFYPIGCGSTRPLPTGCEGSA